MIFAQIFDLLHREQFQRCVNRYGGDKRVRSFSCRDQFLCMAFGQLTRRESLSDIVTCLQAHAHKVFFMGIRGNVAKSTLADANEKRDWRIYAKLAQTLITKARDLYSQEELDFELEDTVYALDATTIDLCLNLFPWAHFRKTKGAVKLHTLIDLRGSIPTFVEITPGNVHDVKRARSAYNRAWRLLRDGSWVYRFYPTLSFSRSFSLLYHSGEEEAKVYPFALPSGG